MSPFDLLQLQEITNLSSSPWYGKLIYRSTPTNQLRFHGCQRAAHGTRKILLVGKDQQGCTCQALFLQKSFLRLTHRGKLLPKEETSAFSHHFSPLQKCLRQKISKNPPLQLDLGQEASSWRQSCGEYQGFHQNKSRISKNSSPRRNTSSPYLFNL